MTPSDTARRGFPPRSVRVRILSAMLAFMAVALAVAGTVSYAVQFDLLRDRVDTELAQEIEELKLIAEHRQRTEGRRDTADELLRAATLSAFPGEHESYLAVVGGRPKYRPRHQAFDLATDEGMAAIEEAYEKDGTVITDFTVDGREVRAVVASVRVEGDGREAIFVAANDVGEQRSQIWLSAGTYAAVGLTVLVLAAFAGARLTGRLLRPIEDLRDATRDITIHHLQRRVPDPGTGDDVADLAHTFNRMLERLESGQQDQRQFMRDVSHELRTPLTIVRGTLETTDVRDPEDVTESHGIAVEELDRMSHLVGDLSTLAKSGRADFVRFAPVDMARFAERAFARIQHLGSRQWSLRCRTTAVVTADEERLTQAVVQLAANAVRYSEDATEVELSVVDTTGADGARVEIAVRDQGVGLAPQDQQVIFDRFVTVDRTPGSSGTGLGLPIVRAIARAHGGTLTVVSRLGHGSTFTLAVPRGLRGPHEIEEG